MLALPASPTDDEEDDDQGAQTEGGAADLVSAAATARGGQTRHHARGHKKTVGAIASMNRRALDAYRRQDMGTALELLRQALAASAASGIGRHPIAATTHAELAAVLVVGFNQPQLGVEHFRRALRIDRTMTLTPRLRTTETMAAFRQAVSLVQPDA